MQPANTYTPQFKSFASLRVLKNEDATSQIAGAYGISESVLHGWVSRLVHEAANIFFDGTRARKEHKPDVEDEYMVRIRMVRRDFGYSQAVVAGYLGLAQNAYARYENGHNQMSVRYIKSLSYLYGVSADYMLGMSEEDATVCAEHKAQAAIARFSRKQTAEELCEQYHVSNALLRLWEQHLSEYSYLVFKTKGTPLVSSAAEGSNTPYLPMLKELRQSSGLSQKDVGAVLGIAQDAYAKYENGVVTLPIRRLIRLCQLFGVTADELLNR